MSVPRRGTVLRRSWWGRAPARFALLATLLAALAVPASAPAATGGKITGRVTDGSGNGLTLGAAYAYRTGATQPVASAWILLGGYTLPVPEDGDYKVYFADQLNSSTVAEFYDDKPSLAQADPVTVSGGATVSHVDAALVTGGKISGRVRTTSGTAINGATVAAYDAGTGAFRTSATTGSTGQYTLPAIAAGATSSTSSGRRAAATSASTTTTRRASRPPTPWRSRRDRRRPCATCSSRRRDRLRHRVR